MMTCFYKSDSVLQIILLVISQFTVISLAAGIVILFKLKCKLPKQAGIAAVFLVNVVLYVVMQLNSRITGANKEMHLHVPYVVLLVVIVLSLSYGLWAALGETRNRKTINHGSIKEAFDNLPIGVCFFNQAGLPVLCNRTMQSFSFDVCGKDVQFITDLEECFDDGFIPVSETRKDGNTFVMSDGSVWYLEKRIFTYESTDEYVQFVATDISDLYENRVKLQKENEHLRYVQTELKRLSANIVAVTREEEILNTKMRVHDEMGRCLVAAQKYLQENHTERIPNSMTAAWQRAVSMLKYNNETSDEDMLLQIRKTCEYVKIAFLQTGELPKEESLAYLLTCAVRECVTNAVRYAEATELYVDFTETDTDAAVTVTNNGKIPEYEIVEGGGLSTLRRRVERAGGIMTVESLPKFRLAVKVPKVKEGVL